MNSEFYSTGMGYVYKWGDAVDDDLLTIEVTQLRQRGGSAYALLSASTIINDAHLIPGADNRVLTGEVFLLNPNSRATYATALEQRIPAPDGAAQIDFRAIIEELAHRVMAAENAPVGVVTLDISKSPKPLPWLIDGLLPSEKPTILYGAGGVGKSIFAAAMAVAVQTGQRFLGLRTTRADVLYLDWETDEADIARRVRLASLGLDPAKVPDLKYASLVRPLDDQVDQLARYVAEEKVGLVIIDSVGMAMNTARDGADPSDTAIRFFRALRSLDTAVLAIDHVSSDDMRKARGAAKPYGSVYKWNSARNALELREESPPDGNGVHLVLKHRKSNLGPRMDDAYIRMVWGDDEVVFARERGRTAVVAPLAQRITDLLSVAPASPRALADLLSDDDTVITEVEVRHVLKALIGAGTVNVSLAGEARLT